MSAGDSRIPWGSSRRALNATDNTISSRSFSLEVALQENLALEEKLEEEASEKTAEASLKRLLSLRSVVSTSSSFAQRQQAASAATAIFKEIGTGSIGKIFEHPGTVFAYKLPLIDDNTKLWNNYIMHQKVKKSFDSLGYIDGQVEIPQCYWFATPQTRAFWDDYLGRFPFDQQFPKISRHVFCMERIFPLPRPVRHALIEKFCPPRGHEKIESSEPDKDCLVRPYLGRVKYGSGGLFFSLRNFKLHANQMQELDLPLPEFTLAMGHAMAVLHWHARIDGNDIEFVLGSSPMEEQKIRTRDTAEFSASDAPTSTYERVTHARADFTQRLISLWMIDFDDCTDITMDDRGVDMAVKAFVETNHYCPRPNTNSNFIRNAWKQFGDTYLRWSHKILDKTESAHLKHLPVTFLEKVNKATAKQGREPSSSMRGRGGKGGRR